jgi:hypothetical protein
MAGDVGLEGQIDLINKQAIYRLTDHNICRYRSLDWGYVVWKRELLHC